MTCTNHSYPEENWVCKTEYDDLPLSQEAVDRVLERQVQRFMQNVCLDSEDIVETVFEFNNHIMMNAPLLYDRVTYKQIEKAFEKKWNNK